MVTTSSQDGVSRQRDREPGQPGANADVGISIVMPCLNEAASVARCVGRASSAIRRTGLSGEVIVCDNGSTDGSDELARNAGARVVYEPERGYGSAYLRGFAAADGAFIVMGDADESYDFGEIPTLLAMRPDLMLSRPGPARPGPARPGPGRAGPVASPGQFSE